MQSVMVGLCTEEHTARTTPRWHLMSQCLVSSVLCLLPVKIQSHTVSTVLWLFNTTFCPCALSAVSMLKASESMECVW